MANQSAGSSPASLARHTPRRSHVSGLLEGWTFTLAVAAAIASLTVAILWVGGTGAAAIGLALRVTARASFALFAAAFTASAAHRLWPSRFTRWQRRNRRYLGVAFAASHAIHGALIIALATLLPEQFHDHTRMTNPIPGTIGYAVILAMAVTSFDRPAAWLGRRAWNALHTVGSFYVWGVFLISFLGRALRMPGYWLPVGLAVAAMAIRVVARRHRGGHGATGRR
jgi:DMSO/TMAO reductase YedYZ heme-binding membrane subunit